MFNKFVKMVYDQAVDAVKKQIEVDEEIKKLHVEQKAERITGKVYAEKANDLKQQIPEIRQQYKGAIEVIHEQFVQALADFYKIDGSKVHEEEKIFDYNVTLSKEQLEELVKKHHDNSFMLQLISEYCNKHKIFISMPLNEKARREAFEQYIRDANYCVFSPYALKVSFFENGDYDPHIDDDFPADPDKE